MKENLLNREVYLTSSLEGFINRLYFEETLNTDFKGVISKIDFNQTCPYTIIFNNGVSMLNVSREHFELISEELPIEEIKNNIKYVLVFKIGFADYLCVKGKKKLFIVNNKKNRHKLIFSSEFEAKQFMTTQKFEKMKNNLEGYFNQKISIKIESYFIKKDL